MKEPNCSHVKTVRVSSHQDLTAAYKASDQIASVYSCDRPKCRDEARFWVQGCTGRTAVVVALPFRKQVSA